MVGYRIFLSDGKRQEVVQPILLRLHCIAG